VTAERATRAARRGASENSISVIIPEFLALRTARYVGHWSPGGVYQACQVLEKEYRLLSYGPRGRFVVGRREVCQTAVTVTKR
jgi:hypothetical protein